MAEMNPTISVIILNITSLTMPVKGQRLSIRSKSKIYLYAVYIRHTVNSKIQRQ